MPANGNGSGSGERETHRWSTEELEFLLEHASDSGPDLVAAFRKKFPKFEGSDQSILGRRYTLLHKATDIETRKRALEHRIEGTKEILRSLEEEYAELIARGRGRRGRGEEAEEGLASRPSA